jgi:hypothetical protein
MAGRRRRTTPVLQGIKESLPAANSESQQAILEFVRDAVRARDCMEKPCEK